MDLVEGGNEQLPIYNVMETDLRKYTRLCPGRDVALSTLWIAAATILTTFNLSKSIDKDGKVIEPSCEYQSAILR